MGSISNDIVIFSGSGHSELAKRIVSRLGLSLAKVTLGHFSNRETSIQIDQSVRNSDVYIIQSFHHHNVNDMLMEMLILIHACKIASAHKVTAVIPYFPYSKQPSGPYDKIANNVESLLGCYQLQYNHKDNHSHSTLCSLEQLGYLSPINTTGIEDEDPHCHHIRITTELLESISQSQSSPLTTPTAAIVKNSIHESTTPTISEEQFILYQQASKSDTIISQQSLLSTNRYKTWRSRNGKLVANMFAVAGTDHIITMDLHDAQYQGFFDIPVDNLKSQPLFAHYIMDNIPEWKQTVIVSPDAGGAKRATQMAQLLGAGFALIHKERRKKRIKPYGSKSHSYDSSQTTKSHNTSSLLVHGRIIVGDVQDKTVIILDDIADTCNTLIKAANVAVSYGAKRVIAMIAHGVFSGNALERLESSPIEQVIVTHSVPIKETSQNFKKLKVLDIGYLFSESIRRIHYGESVSALFTPQLLSGHAIQIVSQ